MVSFSVAAALVLVWHAPKERECVGTMFIEIQFSSDLSDAARITTNALKYTMTVHALFDFSL